MNASASGRRRGAYNDEVRRLFANPAHSGDVSVDAGPMITAHAVEGGAGVRVLLTGITDGARWTTLRYSVFGCPHLIAAAEAAAERFEGLPVESVREFPLDELIEQLEVPLEKTGRILLLEDAFLDLDKKRSQALEIPG